MWLRRSLAVALAVALISGCSLSDSKTYSAKEVVEALGNQGFEVFSVDRFGYDREKGFKHVFPQAVPEGLLSILEKREEYHGPHGPEEGRGDLVLSALIYKNQDLASCAEPNIVGTCLRKRNVVVVVREGGVQAAREALDDLD